MGFHINLGSMVQTNNSDIQSRIHPHNPAMTRFKEKRRCRRQVEVYGSWFLLASVGFRSWFGVASLSILELGWGESMLVKVSDSFGRFSGCVQGPRGSQAGCGSAVPQVPGPCIQLVLRRPEPCAIKGSGCAANLISSKATIGPFGLEILRVWIPKDDGLSVCCYRIGFPVTIINSEAPCILVMAT